MARNRNRRVARLASGLCRCGRERRGEGFRTCEPCAAQERTTRAAIRFRRGALLRSSAPRLLVQEDFAEWLRRDILDEFYEVFDDVHRRILAPTPSDMPPEG